MKQKQKKELEQNAQTFSEWFASYMITHDLDYRMLFTVEKVKEIAEAAHFRGYIRGGHAMMQVLGG